MGASLSFWAVGPLVELTIRLALDALGANPQEEILRGLGRQTLVILCFVLAMPALARRYPQTGLRQLVQYRRAMGLWAFAYACVHLLAYLQFEHDMAWSAIWGDLWRRPFVTVGILCLLAMTLLAATSNRWSMRWLGQRWKVLHRLSWAIVLLGIVHYALHKAGKNDFTQPILFLVIWSGLLLMRLKPSWLVQSRQKASPTP
ncbi:MAG: sulfite oxidase heme-binding subunit YedZ [Burkholderiaceae bacterium]